MNLFVFIATGVVILAAPLYAQELLPLQNSLPPEQTSEPDMDELRRRRALAIAEARASCARQLQSVPQADRLYYLMNECYKDNAHVFRPIEGAPAEVSPPPYDPNRAPVFQPDPLGNTPLTR